MSWSALAHWCPRGRCAALWWLKGATVAVGPLVQTVVVGPLAQTEAGGETSGAAACASNVKPPSPGCTLL